MNTKPETTNPKPINILVLCTGNSCRSQIAHGFLNHFLGGKANVYSAGVETHGLNPGAVATMKEAGIDISHHTSNHVDEYRNISFDVLLTVCDNANEQCPYLATEGKRYHHDFSDPSKVKGTPEEIKEAFRKTREEIRDYCKNLAEEILRN